MKNHLVVEIVGTGPEVASPAPLLKPSTLLAYEQLKLETRAAELALSKADGRRASKAVMRRLKEKLDKAYEKRNAAFKAYLESED